MNKLSSKLIRKGPVYCSTICGCDCKYSDYLRLRKKAKEMCAELGAGWKIKMNHNMGWFCKVEKGKTHINFDYYPNHPNTPDSYSAWIELTLGGQCFQFINSDKNLQKALNKSVKEADALMMAIRKELSVLEAGYELR